MKKTLLLAFALLALFAFASCNKDDGYSIKTTQMTPYEQYKVNERLVGTWHNINDPNHHFIFRNDFVFTEYAIRSGSVAAVLKDPVKYTIKTAIANTSNRIFYRLDFEDGTGFYIDFDYTNRVFIFEQKGNSDPQNMHTIVMD